MKHIEHVPNQTSFPIPTWQAFVGNFEKSFENITINLILIFYYYQNDGLVMMSSSKAKSTSDFKYILYIFSFVVISLSSGLVYGYPHFYNNLLFNGSQLSKSQLGIVYTVGNWTALAGRFGFGIARDRYGTRYTTTFSLISTMFGCFGIAISDKNNLLALVISFFFVGFGSGGQLCLQPVASLFDKKLHGMILASLSGAFQIGGLVFLFLSKMTHNRRKSYSYFAIILLGLAICALVLLPKGHFIKEEDHLEQPNTSKNSSGAIKVKNEAEINFNNKRRVFTERKDVEDEQGKTEINTRAIDLLKSKEYVLLVSWFSTLLLPLQYYIGTIGFQLERKGDEDGKYIDLFSTCYAFAALFSPVMGKIADEVGLGFSQLIATIFTGSSLLLLSSNRISLNYHLFGMVCYSIGRMTVFGMFFTNLGKRFGYDHYGTLAGVGLLVSAMFSLFQYYLIDIAAEGNEYLVNLICGFVVFILGVPYCLWFGWKENGMNEVPRSMR